MLRQVVRDSTIFHQTLMLPCGCGSRVLIRERFMLKSKVGRIFRY